MKINDRAIKSHIQLITQSNDCCLMSRHDLRSYEIDVQMFNDFVSFPKNDFYVREDGKINYKSLRSIKKVDDCYYIQIVNLLEIDKNGDLNREPYIFPDRLYLQFINLKKIDDLNKLIDRMGGFCFFPDKIYVDALSKLYQKTVGSDKFKFLFSNFNFSKEKEVTKIATKSLREINLKFLWLKKQNLEKMVKKYRDNRFGYDDILELNEELGNVSLTFFQPQGYAWKQDAEEIMKKHLLNMTKGKNQVGRYTENQENTTIMHKATIAPAYRIYGHLALCYLELYLDIEAGLKITTCKSCGEIFEKKDKRQVYCRKEKCLKNRKKKQKRKERSQK
jgi:hypothetical protein